MSWEKGYSIVVDGVTKEEIWKVWQDVNNWHKWDTDIEYAVLNGPFEVGAKFLLKPKGGPKVNLEFIEVEPLKAYTDFTRFPLAKMYGEHTIHETKNGLEIQCTIRLKGPLSIVWRKIVAEDIVRGLEKQTAQMIAYAKTQRGRD